MGYIEIAKITKDGVEWVPFENVDKDTKLEIEHALLIEGAL